MQLQRRKDFELVNTWMSCFLKLHGEFLSEVPELREAVVQWRTAMMVEEQRLADLGRLHKGGTGLFEECEMSLHQDCNYESFQNPIPQQVAEASSVVHERLR